MNKTELIAEIAATAGLTKTEAGKAIDAITASISSALKKGEAVTLVGFGTFKVTKRAARNGRNPRTGVELKIAARSAPGFSAGKTLKDALN